MNPVILASSVSKRYIQNEYRPSLRHEAFHLLRRLIFVDPPLAWENEPFWALKNVSFEVKAHESIAIVGRNGAGKTTLLRLLAGITGPTEGQIRIRGRFVALIGLGAGFDFERTGRENIYLNAAIHGVAPRDVVPLLHDIIAFSELGEFLERPVKRYSTGMVARLAFSIAVHILPEIILLDEVLAVGDVAFREKCYARILELKRQGRTILFVTHDSQAAISLCDRALWLHEGELMLDGPVKAVLEAYSFATLQGKMGSIEDDDTRR